MNKMKSFVLCICLLLVQNSCTKSLPIDNSFTVTGSVLNSGSDGIKNIKVYYQPGKFVETDSFGKWKIGPVDGSITIEPLDQSYTFSPTSKTVSGTDTNIIFTGQSNSNPLNSKHPLAENVFNWFMRQQLSNGILESVEKGNVVSLYDNALAALVFIAKDDRARAEAIFNFFNNRINSELLAGNGGFYQFRDAQGKTDGPRWMGDNAWLLIALNNHAKKYNSNTYAVLREKLSVWLRSLQNVDGSVNAGFDNNGLMNFQVTEGMIDAFNAIEGYTSFHSKLLKYFKINRWNSTDKILISWVGNYYKYALDNYSWGFCTFQDFPLSTLENANIFLATQTATVNKSVVTGYCFDVDKDNVWPEGTGQMIVAYQKVGNYSRADFYLAEMEKLLVKSTVHAGTYGIPYASNQGTHYGTAPLWLGADTNLCISSGAWYLFGVLNFDPMAEGYLKPIPSSDKFWIN